MLQFSSASSGIVDSRRAMSSCLADALGEQSTQEHILIVIHATVGHHFDELVEEVAHQYPQAKIVGCSSAGVICHNGACENLYALGIMVVQTDRAEELVLAHCSALNGANSYQQAREMALELKEQQPDINMIQLYASGIDVAADELIAGIESVFGPDMPIFGGTASDNMRAESSTQLCDGHILEHGAVLIGYADPSLEVVMGVHHGSIPIGIGYEVTRSEANRIYEIEGQPAWTFLMNKLNLPTDSHPGPCIPVAGIGEKLPETEQVDYDNSHILRVITKVNPEDQSLYFPVSCKAGTKIWLTQRDEDLIFAGLDRMMSRLTERINGQEIVAVFHTDCAARGRALFNKVLKDEIIRKMQYPLIGENEIPWLGMYGFGEFTLLNGRNRFHNYTTSIYALLRQ